MSNIKTKEEEYFVPAYGFEDKYEISNYGIIRALDSFLKNKKTHKTKKYPKPKLNKSGLLLVQLNGQKGGTNIWQLIVNSFLKPLEKAESPYPIDGNWNNLNKVNWTIINNKKSLSTIFKNRDIPIITQKYYLDINAISEQWKPCVLNENFEISNIGRIQIIIEDIFGNIIDKRICLPYVSPKGYFKYNVGKNKTDFLHRLTYYTWVKILDKNTTINHINGIKTDNRLENLEPMTFAENTLHGIENNLIKNYYGEGHAWSKLTAKEAYYIYNDYWVNNLKSKEIMKKYNVNYDAVRGVTRRGTYRRAIQEFKKQNNIEN